MLKQLIILLSLILSITSCNNDSLTQRAQFASTSNDIHIAIVDSSTRPSRFIDGVKLAIEELNDNGVIGKSIKAIYYDDKGSLDRAQKIAWEIASNPKIIAVIGHFSSKVALSTSITYEKNGIIFITPKATLTDLIRDKNKYTFRNIPSDNFFGLEMAKYAHRNHCKKMAIIYERESYGKRLAEIFQKHGDNLGLSFISVKSYSSWESDFRQLISDLLNGNPFDSILICGNMPASAYIVKQLRDMGLSVPIIGSDSFDSMQLLNIAGKSADGVCIPTVFDPKLSNNLTRNFVENFKYFYGFEPDTLAAQGYDAIKVLSHAIERGTSSIPLVISTNLRFLKNWQGVTGNYSFTQLGDIINKSIYFMTVQKEKFVFTEREFDTHQKITKTIEDIALRIPVTHLDTIDPILLNNNVSIDIVEQLFMGLTDLDPETYKPVPELATHWEPKEDCKQWRFFLRKDAFWTDGQPVTAYDIEKTIKRNLSVQPKSKDAHLLYSIKNAREIDQGLITDMSQLGVKAIDPHTIDFILTYHASHFPIIAGLWMFRPLPVDTIQKNGALWTDPENIKSNGSYQLYVWNKGTQMILKKNPHYCDSNTVSIPEIHYFVVSDPMLGLSMYYNQDFDLLGGTYFDMTIEDQVAISKNPFLNDHYYSLPTRYSDMIIFNLEKNPVDNVLVRKAIAFATNRELIVDSLQLQFATPTLSFLPEPFSQDYLTHHKTNSFNPIKAKQSLAEAGYPNGINFPEISIGYKNSPQNEIIANSIRALLDHLLHIQVKLNPITSQSFKNNEFFGNDILHVRHCSLYPDPSSGFQAFTGMTFDHEQLSTFLDQANKTSHHHNRKQFYFNAEQLVTEKICAVIPLFYQRDAILVNPRIIGWYHMAFGGQHIRNWRLAQY